MSSTPAPLVPLPKAKAVLACSSPTCSKRSPPRRRFSRISLGGGDDGSFILDHTRQSPEFERLRRFHRGRSGGAAVRRVLWRRAEDLPPRLDALERDLAGPRPRLSLASRARPPAQSAIWKLREAALGLSMAMKGRRQVPLVRRRHRRRARAAARLHRAVSRHGQQPRHAAGVYAHASVGCLHVRPVVNLKTEPGVRQFEAIASDSRRSRARVRRRASGEHGDGLVRSPFMAKMFGPVLYDAFCQHQADLRSGRHLQPGQDRRRAAADGQPALRPRVSDAAAVTRSSTTRIRRHAPAPSRCAAASARAARRLTGPCARRTWRRARKRTRRAAARTSCGWRSPASSARPGSATRAFDDGARSLPGVPGLQGGVSGRRGRRPVEERVPGRLLAPPRPPLRARCSAMSIDSRDGAAGSRRCRTWFAAARRSRG